LIIQGFRYFFPGKYAPFCFLDHDALGKDVIWHTHVSTMYCSVHIVYFYMLMCCHVKPCTIKPVLRGHPWDKENVVFYNR
jgi:hypothetical protein